MAKTNLPLTLTGEKIELQRLYDLPGSAGRNMTTSGSYSFTSQSSSTVYSTGSGGEYAVFLQLQTALENYNIGADDFNAKAEQSAVTAVANDLASHKADYTTFKGATQNFVADQEYPLATVVGRQIRATRLGTSRVVKFELGSTITVGTAISISLNGGATSKPLKNLDDTDVTELEKGFVEVVEDTVNFTLRPRGGGVKIEGAIKAARTVGATFPISKNALVSLGNNQLLRPADKIFRQHESITLITNANSAVNHYALRLNDTDYLFGYSGQSSIQVRRINTADGSSFLVTSLSVGDVVFGRIFRYDGTHFIAILPTGLLLFRFNLGVLSIVGSVRPIGGGGNGFSNIVRLNDNRILNMSDGATNSTSVALFTVSLTTGVSALVSSVSVFTLTGQQSKALLKIRDDLVIVGVSLSDQTRIVPVTISGNTLTLGTSTTVVGEVGCDLQGDFTNPNRFFLFTRTTTGVFIRLMQVGVNNTITEVSLIHVLHRHSIGPTLSTYLTLNNEIYVFVWQGSGAVYLCCFKVWAEGNNIRRTTLTPFGGASNLAASNRGEMEVLFMSKTIAHLVYRDFNMGIQFPHSMTVNIFPESIGVALQDAQPSANAQIIEFPW